MTSVPEGMASYVRQIDRRRGNYGASDQSWARFEDQATRMAIKQFFTDRHFAMLTANTIGESIMSTSMTDIERAGGRLLMNAGISSLTFGVGGYVSGPMSLVGDFSTTLETRLEDHFTDHMSGEFDVGGFSFGYDFASRLTPEQIMEFLESEHGQQWLSEGIEAMVAGEVELKGSELWGQSPSQSQPIIYEMVLGMTERSPLKSGF